MTTSHWKPLPRIGYIHLRAARLQAHYAAQWLARVARACVPEKSQDWHTNLGWDDALGGFVTHPLPDGTRFALRIADLTLAVLGAERQELALDGRADAEVRAWLGRAMAARGFDDRKLDTPAPYALPSHALVYGARYSLDELSDSFTTLSAWFGNANAALDVARKKLAGRRLKAPPVRCWPHHFDLDCLVHLGRDRSMGMGFCPGDEFCDEPYFYVSMWPEPPIPQLPLLPAMAHWHTYKFLAAMAPAHKILAAHEQGAYVRQFLDVSVAAALQALRLRPTRG